MTLKSRLAFAVLVTATLAAALPAQDISTALLAHFDLNGNALDSSGNHLDGLISDPSAVGSTTDHLGNPGGALEFFSGGGGGAGYFGDLKITGSGLNLADHSLTVAFWFNKQNADFDHWVFSLGSDFSDYNALHISLNSGSPLRFAFFNNDSDYGGPVQDSTWIHFAGTYDFDAQVRRIYLDGTLVLEDTGVSSFQGNSDFAFGAPGVAMDDLRIYDRALTGADVAALTTVSAVPEPALTAVVFGVAALFALYRRRGNKTSEGA